MDAVTNVPQPVNEPVHDYAPGSPEREKLTARLKEMATERVELTMAIGGEHRLGAGEHIDVVQPHNRKALLGTLGDATAADVRQAVEAAKAAAPAWQAMSFDDRAAIFLTAADLLTGPWRATLNAATMLGQSKTCYQAEIDAACEMADFWRFNVAYAREILQQQPVSGPGVWNRLDHRPLEGFVLAITPFNFTAIAGNLSTAPALMGNTVVWKPAPTQQLSAHYTMQLLEACGLPPGVVNMVTGRGQAVSEVALPDPALAGIHFTGSTRTFGQLWDSVAGNLRAYRAYPRLVGETGGKDFVLAHPSADIDVLRVALVRGAFEYQGQKCSAASRAYVPRSLWTRMREDLVSEVDSLPMGDITDFHNFVGAVIDDRSFAKLSAVIDRVRGEDGVKIAAGGSADDSIGILRASDRCPGRRHGPRGVHHRVFRSHPGGLRLRRLRLRHGAARLCRRRPVWAHRLHHRPGPGRHRRGDGRAAVRSRQFLHQRQADRGGGGAAAVRRCPRQRDQRQGRVHPEPAALGLPPHD